MNQILAQELADEARCWSVIHVSSQGKMTKCHRVSGQWDSDIRDLGVAGADHLVQQLQENSGAQCTEVQPRAIYVQALDAEYFVRVRLLHPVITTGPGHDVLIDIKRLLPYSTRELVTLELCSQLVMNRIIEAEAEGQTIIIAGKANTGKTALAHALLLQQIERGATCVSLADPPFVQPLMLEAPANEIRTYRWAHMQNNPPEYVYGGDLDSGPTVVSFLDLCVRGSAGLGTILSSSRAVGLSLMEHLIRTGQDWNSEARRLRLAVDLVVELGFQRGRRQIVAVHAAARPDVGDWKGSEWTLS